MSAFLGPIHYWLFKKIKIQDKMTDRILKLNEKKGWIHDLRDKVDRQYGVLEQEELENIIEEGNIHGWLQERVSLVENRLAYVVTLLNEAKPNCLTEVYDEMEQLGVELSETLPDNAVKAYQMLQDILLDGMPCDHVNQIVEENENEVIWKRTRCIHQDYWHKMGGTSSFYYQLRNYLLKGILEQTAFAFNEQSEGVYKLYKKE